MYFENVMCLKIVIVWKLGYFISTLTLFSYNTSDRVLSVDYVISCNWKIKLYYKNRLELNNRCGEVSEKVSKIRGTKETVERGLKKITISKAQNE